MLNFTYILKEPKDGAFGTLQDDGTWNGMVRLLQDQEADIGKARTYKDMGGTRASYENESREHFGYFSKIANLPQLSCLCLHIFVCLTRLKLSVSQYAYCTQSCNFKIKTKFKLLGQICNKSLQSKCSRDSFL